MESPQDINLIKQVTTLVADVKNLKEGQDTFHREMKETLKELKDGYASRIDALEARNNWYTGALAVIGVCGALISYIYFTQQATQDVKIDQIINQTK